jgi:hypothetical protein
MNRIRIWILVGTAVALILASLAFIIAVAPYQVIRNDPLGYMLQYTAAWALGIIIGVYFIYHVIRRTWLCQ